VFLNLKFGHLFLSNFKNQKTFAFSKRQNFPSYVGKKNSQKTGQFKESLFRM